MTSEDPRNKFAIAQEGDAWKAGFVCGIFAHLLDRAASAAAWDRSLSPVERTKRVDDVANTMSLTERMALRTGLVIRTSPLLGRGIPQQFDRASY